MPEDEAPSIAEDTPTEDQGESQEGTPAEPESPQEDGSQTAEEVDWQQRYQNLQPDYTRATQEAAQYRQIIELARQGDAQALEYLGLEAEDDTEDEDDFEAEEPITRADFQAWLQQQAEERAAFEAEEAELDEAETYFRQEVQALEKEHGELSDEEYKYIADYASVISDEEGRPAVKDAWDHLTKAVESRHKTYLESKKAPKVELGQAGQEKIDMADDDARVNLLAAHVEAGNQAD